MKAMNKKKQSNKPMSCCDMSPEEMKAGFRALKKDVAKNDLELSQKGLDFAKGMKEYQKQVKRVEK